MCFFSITFIPLEMSHEIVIQQPSYQFSREDRESFKDDKPLS